MSRNDCLPFICDTWRPEESLCTCAMRGRRCQRQDNAAHEQGEQRQVPPAGRTPRRCFHQLSVLSRLARSSTLQTARRIIVSVRVEEGSTTRPVIPTTTTALTLTHTHTHTHTHRPCRLRPSFRSTQPKWKFLHTCREISQTKRSNIFWPVHGCSMHQFASHLRMWMGGWLFCVAELQRSGGTCGKHFASNYTRVFPAE